MKREGSFNDISTNRVAAAMSLIVFGQVVNDCS